MLFDTYYFITKKTILNRFFSRIDVIYKKLSGSFVLFKILVCLPYYFHKIPLDFINHTTVCFFFKYQSFYNNINRSLMIQYS